MITKKESVDHITQYYETDQMGVIHHVNYVKWMEEARNKYLMSVGIYLGEFNKNNIHMAVLSQKVDYKKYIKFNEKIKITCGCNKLSTTKMTFTYNFYNENGILCAIGETEHCFVNEKIEPIVFKKEFPTEYNNIIETIE